jgi:hypothetical protein
LNREAFYAEHEITQRWVRLEESVAEYKAIKVSESVMVSQ